MKNYLINLDRRRDRLATSIVEFNKVNMKFERIEATDTKPGWMGCLASHLEALARIQDNHRVAGVYEDDVRFLNLSPMDFVDSIQDELPPDWDMLYLGCSPQEPFKRYSEHLYQMGRSYTTHAIIWHNRDEGALDFILSREWGMKYDLILSDYIHPNFNCFCTYPLICTQYQTQSDVCKRSDLSTIERNYKKYIR
jgi:GR25 family glycosyltransferase involved in LPS biosynthesis